MRMQFYAKRFSLILSAEPVGLLVCGGSLGGENAKRTHRTDSPRKPTIGFSLSAEDEIILQIIHGTFNLRRFYFIRTLTFARCVISVLVLLIDGC